LVVWRFGFFDKLRKCFPEKLSQIECSQIKEKIERETKCEFEHLRLSDGEAAYFMGFLNRILLIL